MAFPRDKIFKGHSVPYGSMVGISPEARTCYYMYGYKNDHDLPALPDVSTVVEEENDPEEALYMKERNALLHDALARLTPRQAKVLQLRCGIGTNFDYTLEEIARCLDLTRERIRQIEAKALRRMKHPYTNLDLLMTVLPNDPKVWKAAKVDHDYAIARDAYLRAKKQRDELPNL